MNWGTGITIGMVAFMSFIVVLVTKMVGQKVDLVQEGYYKSDLEYEKQQTKIANYQALTEKVTILKKEGKIEIGFPESEKNLISNGTIVLFRPSEKKEDKNYELKLDSNGKQVISTQSLSSGLWKIKLEWKEANKAFYTEKEIML